MTVEELLNIYKTSFESVPRAFRSPGRINVIGEHTDYNEGFVLPAAVDKEIKVLMGLNRTDSFHFYSVDNDEWVHFTLENHGEVKAHWAQYLIGVLLQALNAGGRISGVDAVFSGNVPLGAGLSSSAALECATLFGFSSLFGLNLDKFSIAKLSQKAENEHVGVKCGIMDQFASVFCEEGQAIRLDCQDLSYEPFELDLKGHQFVLIDTMVKHSLASSEYNVRRSECEEGVKYLKKTNPEIYSLRDVSMDLLVSNKENLNETVYQRCKYVLEENKRVSEACVAMQNNDLNTLGDLLYQSHHGLSYDYEVSCKELDFLVDFTKNQENVLGARMMGGGFGGCTINLVKEDFIDEFKQLVTSAYQNSFNVEPNIYVVKTASGTSEIKNFQNYDRSTR
ncbi:MAG: galactokinase [Bacteroidota bacterium]